MAKSKPLLWSLGLALVLGGLPNLTKALIPSDTYYREQGYLSLVKAERAWDIGTGSPNVVIAILDSGVQITHPDLAENIWTNVGEVSNNGLDDDGNGYVDDVHGWDFVKGVADPGPKLEGNYTLPAILHGTMVAGVAAGVGSNAAGVAGICFRCKVMPLRVLDEEGSGEVGAVIEAIDYAIANRANILNLSFVGVHGSPALGEALQRAWRAGLVIVAAAGHDGEGQAVDMDSTPQYPVCSDSSENIIIGVGAVDEDKKLAAFSNYGKRCVDIVAPGTKFVGLEPVFPNQENFRQLYGAWWSGTSLAAPVVSGAAGLLKSIYPSLTNAEIRDRLLGHAESLALQNPELYTKMGSGLLNIFESLVPPVSTGNGVPTNYFYPGIVTVMTEGQKTQVRIFDHRKRLLRQFMAFDRAMAGASVAVGDLDHDGTSEIIVGAGKGAEPYVRIFTESGDLIGEWLVYAKHFRGGVAVAVGDVNGDGVMEIVTAPGQGGGPHVRIFDGSGKLLNQFFAYASGFRGGVSVAVADTNGDGREEIITGAGVGGGPHVRIFDFRGGVRGGFFAFPQDYRKGIRVAAGNLENGRASIVVTPASSHESVVRVFSKEGRLQRQFRAYPKPLRGGVSVAVGNVDGDGRSEIITAPGPSSSTSTPEVLVFKATGDQLTQFFALSKTFLGGVNVSSK